MSTITPESVTDVVVLSWERETVSDRRAREIAAWLGAETATVAAGPALSGSAPSLLAIVPPCRCVVVEAETLAALADRLMLDSSGLASLAQGLGRHLFVHGFQATDRHAAVLRALSFDALSGVKPSAAGVSAFDVTSEHREWCGQFSGLRVPGVDSSRDGCFVRGSSDERCRTMIRLGPDPFFSTVAHHDTQVSCVAGIELANLDDEVSRQTSPTVWFSRLIPLMMVLRRALGVRAWHNPRPRACFIIDDPMLRKRHGFLTYEHLLDSLRRHRFSAAIAFIPWNYRRSAKATAALVAANQDVVSLTIHGCDHTFGEFASRDVPLLLCKARQAVVRMDGHRQRTGIPYDDVMVFPQGLFEGEALEALSTSGYLAAVNSDVFPASGATLSLRELLDVAVTRFGDFPLFVRRYPSDLAEFAFDLFIGKPALAVEHHGFLRNGYAALESFVDGVNALEVGTLEWTNLATACGQAFLKRVSDGDVHIRFYTNRLHLKNSEPRPIRYVLHRHYAMTTPQLKVAVNGQVWRSERDSRQLTIRLSLEPGQEADILLGANSSHGGRACWTTTRTDRAKVRIRRYLSDFRDNHVDTNRMLSAIVAKARDFGNNRLKRSPGRVVN